MDEEAIAVLLDEPRGGVVGMLIKQHGHAAESRFVGGNFVKGGQQDISLGGSGGNIANSFNVSPVGAIAEGCCQLEHGFFCHAVGQDIGLGIKKERATDGIVPAVVMSNAPQTGLYPTQHDGLCGLEVLPNQVCIDDRGPVRPYVDAAGSIIVLMAELIQAGVIGHHGIYRPGGNAPEQSRRPQPCDVPPVPDGWLGNQRRFKTVLPQILADDCGADLGTIDVGIPGHQNDIRLFPAQGLQLCCRSR